MGTTKAASAKLAVAAIALVTAGVVIALQYDGGPKGPSQRAFYLDLGTGDVFIAPPSALPIQAPSGSQGVQARVASCGACTADQWRVLTIESSTAEAQQVLANPPREPDDPDALAAWSDAASAGKLIALPPAPGEEPQWVRFADYLSLDNNDPVVHAIRRASENLCPAGQAVTTCMP